MMNGSNEDGIIETVKTAMKRLTVEGMPVKQSQFPSVFTGPGSLNTGEKSAMIGALNAMIELGHPTTASLFMGMITHRDDLIAANRVTVIGPDLQELSPGRHSFGLIILACSKEASESDRRVLLSLVTRCDLPVGCMVRVSSGKIWIRLSQDALDEQVTLELLGSLLLAESHKHKGVFGKIEVIFVVARNNEIEMLRPMAEELAEGRRMRYRDALNEKMECATGLTCDECPENETCNVLRDAVAARRRKRDIV